MRGFNSKLWRSQPVGLTAGALLLVLTLAAASVPLWISYSPTQIEAAQRLKPPSWQHWFGTDHFGRDVFSRVVHGARVSLLIGLAVAFSTTILGTIVGLLSGYYRRLDNVLMRVVDGVMAFPAILLAISLVAALGGSMVNLIAALTFAFWPIMARVVRSSTLQLRGMQFVEAAQVMGTRNISIMFLHVLPNALTPIIVQATFIFAEAVLAEAALSFLGLGIEPPTPTWGNMLGESRTFLITAPWFSIFPGIAVVVTVLALNIFGDMLRDLLDPRSSR